MPELRLVEPIDIPQAPKSEIEPVQPESAESLDLVILPPSVLA